MSIRTLSYELHQEINRNGFDVKRSHVYELIAAALGFNSYNELHLNAIPLHSDLSEEIIHSNLIAERCKSLGVSVDLMSIFQTKLSNYFFIYKTKDELAQMVRDVLDNDEEFEDSIILRQLKKSFEIYPEDSIYPYLIAQFYCDCENTFFASQDMKYLYERYLQGKEISPTWKPDLDQFIKRKKRNEYLTKNYVYYLQKAAKLGSFPAQLQLHEGPFYDKEDSLEDYEHGSCDYKDQFDPTYFPNIELELAKRGDEEALKDIFDRVTPIVFEDHEEYTKELKEECLLEAWKWQKFALYHGLDLAKGDYRTYAIDEHGKDYDDDVGGPIFVAESGRENIHLPKLSVEQEKIVNKELKQLINFYENLDDFSFGRYSDNVLKDWDDEECEDDEDY